MTKDLVFEFKPAFRYKEGVFEVLSQDLMDSVGGVYACYIGVDLKYIGSYSNSLQQRWINKKLTKFVHFKADILKEMAEGKFVDVFALPMYSIAESFDYSPWINQESVESRLIEMYNPPLNVVKKNDKNKSGKS